MLDKISAECFSCKERIELQDLECPNCNEYDEDREGYTNETIKNLVMQFLEGNQSNIDDPNYDFMSESEYNKITKAEAIEEWKNMKPEEIFLQGVKSARGFVKIEIICDALEYGVDLQHLYDEKIGE